MPGQDLAFHKSRIAPTPSGFLHLGNVYSFALTAALAKKTGAKILLRIDDMDTERVHKEYIDDIFDTLNFMGIAWQEGPQNSKDFGERFSQHNRMKLYDHALQKLRDENLVYACNCSRSQIHSRNKDGVYPGTCRHKNISLDEENVSWRLKTDSERIISVKMFNEEPVEVQLPAEVQDIVIRRKDKLPAYQLTSVVDDDYFGIDFIVRGKDLWPSTVLQLYLAYCLGIKSFRNVTFFHHDLFVDEQGKKLSKSAGSLSVKALREQGFTREQVYEKIESQVIQ